MISPELLRRYPFFGFLDDSQLKAVAMIAEEISGEKGETLLETEKPAEALYLLIEGGIDLYYTVTERDNGAQVKEFYITEISPGEIFGISALIEPYQYTLTVRVAAPSRIIKIEAAALRALCEVDTRLAYGLMRQTAKAAMSRLHDTRIQLAAARA
jgi:CRP-like cAMP-binding protein